MRETQVRSLSREDPLEKEMATHSSILAWRTPWTDELGRLHTVHGVTKSRTRLSDFTSLHFMVDYCICFLWAFICVCSVIYLNSWLLFPWNSNPIGWYSTKLLSYFQLRNTIGNIPFCSIISSFLSSKLVMFIFSLEIERMGPVLFNNMLPGNFVNNWGIFNQECK